MNVLLSVINWLMPLLYLALVIDYGATFFLGRRMHARSPLLVLVIAVHAGLIVLRGVHIGRPPLTGNYEVLSVVALACAAVYGLLEAAGGDRRAGLFVFLMIFLFQYTSSTFLAHAIAAGIPAEPDTPASWSRLHVVPAVTAYTAFGFACVYGLLHLLAQRGLRRHRFGLLFDRLPPLESLAKMTWYALLVGVACMTVSIATGAIFFSHLRAATDTHALDPKVTWKIIIGSTAWVIYVVAVLGRLIGRWPPARVSLIAVGGFLVTLAMLVTSTALS